MLSHDRPCFWRYAVDRGDGNAVRDCNAAIFADATNGHFGDFVTVALLKSTGSDLEVMQARIERGDARHPDYAEIAEALHQLALASLIRRGISYLPPSAVFSAAHSRHSCWQWCRRLEGGDCRAIAPTLPGYRITIDARSVLLQVVFVFFAEFSLV